MIIVGDSDDDDKGNRELDIHALQARCEAKIISSKAMFGSGLYSSNQQLNLASTRNNVECLIRSDMSTRLSSARCMRSPARYPGMHLT